MPWHLECVQLLSEELNDPTNNLTTVLTRCGQNVLDDLRASARDILTGTAVQPSCVRLDILIDNSRKEITSAISTHLLAGWIRIYTDACILRSLVDIGPPTAIRSISRLDGVLITCGFASGRLDLINSLIMNIQRSYLMSNPHPVEFTAPQRGCQATHNLLESSCISIPSYSEPPSISFFQSKLSEKPFIIRRYASDWPATAERPWGSAAYLRTVSGPGRIVPVEVGKDYRKTDWTQELMSWDDFLATLDLTDQPSPSKMATTIYLAQHNLSLQFPSLLADIIVPDYVYASMTPPELANYQPPGNQEGFVVNMWLGPEGTISPAHTDPYHNLFVQVVGRKTVWLAPPKLAPFMYTLSSNADAQNLSTHSTELGMLNTSRVDVFSATADAFPGFWREVAPKAQSAVLEPEDLLYIPPGWWHAMRGETTSFSVSIWF